MKLIVLPIILFISLWVHGFPEMVRHNYVNCSTCHVSNSGGGLLNAYGRSISKELLSTWGTETESRAFYTINPETTSDWLNIGGDVRMLQLHQENKQIKSGRNIWMEANIQASVNFKRITLFASYGQVKQGNQSFEFKNTKSFLSYQVTDEWSVRLGRYVPIYGLNIPQHNYFIRRNLAFGPGTERDAADIQFNGENWNLAVGVSQSLKDSSVLDQENALNLQLQKNLNDQHKLGLNYWYGEAENYKKIIFGVQAVLGFTEKFYMLAEVDHLWLKNSVDIEEKSAMSLAKLGYELEKGFHFQAVQEWATSRADDQLNYGVGIVWYPRPHFEFETLYSKKTSQASTTGVEDYAYLLAHFYF